MDFYVVENAITAGYYHQRNIARIESQAADILDASVTAQHPIVRSNTGVRMMTLSFEYQAYLFAFRRTFEYLAAGILAAFGLPAPRHIRDTARDLAGGAPKYVQWVNPMQSEVVKVARQFKDVLAEHSPRNRTAHKRPVEARAFLLGLEPGKQPRIGLEGGGEDLPMRSTDDIAGEKLSVVLERQLVALTDSVFT